MNLMAKKYILAPGLQKNKKVIEYLLSKNFKVVLFGGKDEEKDLKLMKRF